MKTDHKESVCIKQVHSYWGRGVANLGRLLAPKRMELGSPAKSPIEDNVMSGHLCLYFVIPVAGDRLIQTRLPDPRPPIRYAAVFHTREQTKH